LKKIAISIGFDLHTGPVGHARYFRCTERHDPSGGRAWRSVAG